MNNNELFENQGQGVLYVSGTRGYSAYEIAVQNGFVGTEEEWLDSLVGPQGEPGTPFDELTEEQKAEITGEEGKSAYEIAVENGFIGTEQDWVNSFLTPDGYVKKAEFENVKINDSLVCNIAYRDCSEWINGITEESEEQPIVGYIQGFTTTPTTFLIARQTGGNYENKTNMIYLQEVSKLTGELVRQSYLELGHANALAYNEDEKEIYVAYLLSIEEGVSRENSKIIIVDYDTLTIKETIILDKNNFAGYAIRGVSYDNKNKVLAYCDEDNVFIMNDFHTIKQRIPLNFTETALRSNPIDNRYSTVQTAVVYDNKIYHTRYFENAINIFDLEGNLIKNIYDFQNDLDIVVGEFEQIAIEEDGTLYIAAGNTSRADNACLYDILILKTNLIKNGYKNYYYDNINTHRLTFYVDADTTNHIQIGTSKLPFKHIQQAIMTVENIKRDVSINIECVKSNKNLGFLLSKQSKDIILHGNNNDIYAIHLANQNGTIEYLNVISDTLVNISWWEDAPSNIFIERSPHVYLNHINIINENQEKQTNGMVIYDSDVFTNQVTYSGFVNCNKLLNFAFLKQAAITVENSDYWYYCTSNNKIVYGDSKNIFNRCNPEGYYPAYLDYNQDIPYVFDENILTLNNQSYGLNHYNFEIRYTVTLENGFSYHRNVILRHHMNDSFITIGETYMFYVYVFFNFLENGKWNIQLSVIRETISDGTKQRGSNQNQITIDTVRTLV